MSDEPADVRKLAPAAYAAARAKLLRDAQHDHVQRTVQASNAAALRGKAPLNPKVQSNVA